jgi:hypothetical protein
MAVVEAYAEADSTASRIIAVIASLPANAAGRDRVMIDQRSRAAH